MKLVLLAKAKTQKSQLPHRITMYYVHILLLFLLPSSVAPLEPNAEIIAEFQDGPFDVYDWSEIGRYKINRQIDFHDPKEICCSTNYSIIWDNDDELISFAMENFLCPKTVELFELDAIGPDAVWETFTRALNRANGIPKDDIHEQYYEGNYPGVTGWPVHYNVLMTLRRCMTPFVGIFFDAEQYNLRLQLLDDYYRNTATNIADEIDEVEMTWSHIEEEEDKSEGEDDDSESDGGSSSDSVNYEYDDDDDVPVKEFVGNPLLPSFKGSFWASAALPASELRKEHSAPHYDGVETGVASVYTLTKDTKYEKTGTTFNKCQNITIVHNKQLETSRSGDDLLIQSNALNLEQSKDSGWLNTSKNRFSEIIVLARNKFNRIILYPKNRYHTAFIPDESLLNANPKLGRLTLNTFWQLWNTGDGSQENSNHCEDAQYSYSVSNMQKGYGARRDTMSDFPANVESTLSGCNACKSWQASCAWCPYTSKCEKTTDFMNCPSQNVLNIDFNPINFETTCSNTATLIGSCVGHTSCDKCVQDGCAWCASKGRCTRDVIRACSALIEHVTDLGGGGTMTCQADFTNHDCTQHRGCTTCTAQDSCQWCSKSKKCVVSVKNIPICDNYLMKEDIVGKYGLGSCPKQPTLGEGPKLLEMMPRDCISPLTCNECLNVKGCGWCVTPEFNSGECVTSPAQCHDSKTNYITESLSEYIAKQLGEDAVEEYRKECPLVEINNDILDLAEVSEL
jgi:hypothetical protein